MTRTCPHWLQLSEDRQRFLPVAERVAAVRLVFSLACQGRGCKAIVDTLEQRGIVSPTGRRRWHPNVIIRLLKDRATLGEFQPMERVAKYKSAAVGPPIPGYFPTIIRQEVYDKANALMTSHTIKRVGRIPDRVNVFAGLLFDPAGNPYHVEHRHPATYRILSARYGKGGTCISYEKTLEAWLAAVREIDPADFAATADDETGPLVEELASIDAKIAAIKIRVRKEQDVEYLLDLLRDLRVHKEAVKEKLDKVEASRRSPVREAVQALQKTTLEDPEFYRARLRLAVERITMDVVDIRDANASPWKQAWVQIVFRRGITRLFAFQYRSSRGYLAVPISMSYVFDAETLKLKAGYRRLDTAGKIAEALEFRLGE
jgi:hypothetical protein